MAKNVKDLMTSNPCSIDSDKSTAYAAKMMRDENVGLAPIVEGDRLIGTVTDRDITIRVVAEGKDPESTKVTEIASTELVTVTPQQDLDEALRLMAKHQVSVVAQADVARNADDSRTGELVEQISK